MPRALAAARQAHTSVPTAPRILLIRPDHLGDLVLTTPILNAIKQHAPNAHITMMVGSWSSEIVARHPAIDRLVVVPFPGFQRAPQKALAPYILLLSLAKHFSLTRCHFILPNLPASPICVSPALPCERSTGMINQVPARHYQSHFRLKRIR